MFDKSIARFPVKAGRIDLNHCGIAPMYAGAAEAEHDCNEARVREGVLGAAGYGPVLRSLHESAARLLETDATNISFMKNAAEGLSLIAFGYPFEPGDEVISYVHEYPSNHYPWRLQEARGAVLKLLPDVDPSGVVGEGRPRGWSLNNLEALVTPRTRVLAISHVQFTSGFAADLEAVGQFCHDRGIDLIIDAAQSLGCLPVLPERWHIAAVACSGWKWLMGAIGCGLLYTSPALREQLRIVMAGADIVTQGDDYLNHTWHPHSDGRRFEYSTVPMALAAGLDRCLRDLFMPCDIASIRDEVFRLQDVFLSRLDRTRLAPVVWPERNRSGILSLVCADAPALARRLMAEGVTVTARGGYLRVAPHFYNDDEQLVRVAELLSAVAASG